MVVTGPHAFKSFLAGKSLLKPHAMAFPNPAGPGKALPQKRSRKEKTAPVL
jgi:hypothetical protein